MIEDKLVLRISWGTMKFILNCYNLSAIFMNNPGEFEGMEEATLKDLALF